MPTAQSANDTIRTPEFDRFGPWIYEMKSMEDIPKLFMPYADEIMAAEFRIKIPRNIERRNADATMDLYEVVLCVYPHTLLLLRRHAHGTVERLSIDLMDILAMKNFRQFNFGEITFYLVPNRQVQLTYNAVSADIMDKCLRYIRRAYSMPYELPLTCEDRTYQITEEDTYFYYHLLRRLRASSDAYQVLFVDYVKKPIDGEKTWVDRLLAPLNLLMERPLIGTLCLMNQQEYLIVNHEKGKNANYSHSFTYIPYTSNPVIQSTTDSLRPNIRNLHIKLKEHQLTYLLPQTSLNPDLLLKTTQELFPVSETQIITTPLFINA